VCDEIEYGLTFPQSKPQQLRPLFLIAVTTLSLACSSKPPETDASPVVLRPLERMASQQVLVLPVQYLSGSDSLGWQQQIPDRVAYLASLDDQIEAAERRTIREIFRREGEAYFRRVETDILKSLGSYDVVYLSAITLSLYSESGRARLFAGIKRAREAGARFAFDTNFRARGWPDLNIARAVYQEAFALTDIVLASTEDLLPLYPGESHEGLLARIPSGEVVLKLSEPASIVRIDGISHQIKAEPVTKPVVDTTAAGDSFAAAYIAARLAGANPLEAARAGHRLAGVVVCHPGAIIPRTAMPQGIIGKPATSRKATP